MKINRIKHQDIDKLKYDEIIQASRNGTLYAVSWYLDITSPGWELLATPDYHYVMPLPKKKKFGISYILQPLFSQQLGVFSEKEISMGILEEFLKQIKVPFCYMHLNSGNLLNKNKQQLLPNYFLDITYNYDDIKKSYNRNTKTQLKKISQLKLIVEENVNIEFALEFIRINSIHYINKAYNISSQVISEALRRDILYIWGMKDEITSQIIAVACFILWKNTFYYLLPVSSPRGKELQAMRFLIDRFIFKYSGSGKKIDFEGSSIQSVAQFYKSFGAVQKSYPYYTKNYPFTLIRLLKK